jgi:hypothetical protein
MTRRPEPAHIVADSLARLSAADRSSFLRELLADTAAGIVVIDGTEAAAMAIYRLGDAVVSRKVGA